MHGGVAIGQGSYGCVFRPALACAGQSAPPTGDFVSKLMTKDLFDDEHATMLQAKSIVTKLPNYDNYFLVDSDTCIPGPLSIRDVQSFDTTCKNVSRRAHIGARQINQKLNQLRLINMPYGGAELYSVVMDSTTKMSTMQKILDQFPALLIAVRRLNEHHQFYHCDMKTPNMLVEQGTHRPRVMDWGLARSWVSPDRWETDWSFYAYNYPWTQLLCDDLFRHDAQLDTQDFTGQGLLLEIHMMKALREFDQRKRQSPHLQEWRDVSAILFTPDGAMMQSLRRTAHTQIAHSSPMHTAEFKQRRELAEKHFLWPQVARYLASAHMQFPTPDLILEHSFRPWIDIWGCMTVYADMMTYMYSRHMTRLAIDPTKIPEACVQTQHRAFDALGALVHMTFFEFQAEPPIGQLLAKMREISALLLDLANRLEAPPGTAPPSVATMPPPPAAAAQPTSSELSQMITAHNTGSTIMISPPRATATDNTASSGQLLNLLSSSIAAKIANQAPAPQAPDPVAQARLQAQQQYQQMAQQRANAILGKTTKRARSPDTAAQMLPPALGVPAKRGRVEDLIALTKKNLEARMQSNRTNATVQTNATAPTNAIAPKFAALPVSDASTTTTAASTATVLAEARRQAQLDNQRRADERARAILATRRK